MAQMPKGVPVGCLAIDGAFNAGILAASIIGNFDKKVKSRLDKWRRFQTQSIKKNLNKSCQYIRNYRLWSVRLFLHNTYFKKLKIKTVVISDDEHGPAQNYSDEFIFTKYSDKNKFKDLLVKVDIVTYEFENIPIEILIKFKTQKKFLPKPEINQIIQNRKLENICK